jgi:hypothetical protein
MHIFDILQYYPLCRLILLFANNRPLPSCVAFLHTKERDHMAEDDASMRQVPDKEGELQMRLCYSSSGIILPPCHECYTVMNDAG